MGILFSTLLSITCINLHIGTLSIFAGNPYNGEDYSSDEYYSSDDYDSYSSDDDYQNENDHERVIHTVPEFVSKPQTDLWVNEGDTIKLPCMVDKLGKVLLCSRFKFHGSYGKP